MTHGRFVISLDFELHWGVAELFDLNKTKDYFEATRKSIPQVLSLFTKYDIHATWATVGFLFAKDKNELLSFSPEEKPQYKNQELSYYNMIDSDIVGEDELSDPYHYAPSLIQQILETKGQELASHTFAHYYCTETGQDKMQFDADLKSAQRISKAKFNIELKSLVFPRNQFNQEYLEIARSNGITSVRTNPDVWFWKGTKMHMRLARLADIFLPIAGRAAGKKKAHSENGVLLLPADRFLRPYRRSEKLLHALKFSRIKMEMKSAAQNNLDYHLWWHPHNFGYDTKENLQYLEDILKYYSVLKEKYDFRSYSMGECAGETENNRGDVN